MKNIEVVAAIIKKDNKILCTQRQDKGETALKWEFPGGKLEPGETNEEALVREIKEELEMEVEVCNYFITVNHQYSFFDLVMHGYVCNVIDDKLVLNEHVDSCWLKIEELDSLDWSEADKPIVEKLMKSK
jgi:8-oxo-dGTP diphosphatase